jgi:hypothetical protein
VIQFGKVFGKCSPGSGLVAIRCISKRNKSKIEYDSRIQYDTESVIFLQLWLLLKLFPADDQQVQGIVASFNWTSLIRDLPPVLGITRMKLPYTIEMMDFGSSR